MPTAALAEQRQIKRELAALTAGQYQIQATVAQRQAFYVQQERFQPFSKQDIATVKPPDTQPSFGIQLPCQVQSIEL